MRFFTPTILTGLSIFWWFNAAYAAWWLLPFVLTAFTIKEWVEAIFDL